MRSSPSSIQIDLDDEWASLRGLEKPAGQESPGTLVLKGYTIIEGDMTSMRGGWISEITADGDRLTFVFCDKPPLLLRATAVQWRSTA